MEGVHPGRYTSLEQVTNTLTGPGRLWGPRAMGMMGLVGAGQPANSRQPTVFRGNRSYAMK